MILSTWHRNNEKTKINVLYTRAQNVWHEWPVYAYVQEGGREGGRVDIKGAFYSEGEIRFFKSTEKIIPKNYPDLKI